MLPEEQVKVGRTSFREELGIWSEKPPPVNNPDIERFECVLKGGHTLLIFLYPCAKDRIIRLSCQHRTETGGVLIGEMHYFYEEEQKYYYVEVRNAYHAPDTLADETRLTFTAESWARISDAVERDFPDQLIVGWYHTHPGHGVYLSEPDVAIQNDFFGKNGQIALVIDPVAKEASFFAGFEDEDSEIVKAVPPITWVSRRYERGQRTPPSHARRSVRDRIVRWLTRRRETKDPGSESGEEHLIRVTNEDIPSAERTQETDPLSSDAAREGAFQRGFIAGILVMFFLTTLPLILAPMLPGGQVTLCLFSVFILLFITMAVLIWLFFMRR